MSNGNMNYARIKILSCHPAGPSSGFNRACRSGFINLPQDLLEQKMTEVQIPEPARHNSVATSGIDNALLSEIASILVSAHNPLIIIDYSGRHPSSVSSLIELAELLGARVFTAQTNMSFPTDHSLFSGFYPNPYLANADVILSIDIDVPYVPSQVQPKSDAKIIHIDMDALKENVPLWGFPVDILVRALLGQVLPALSQLIRQNITPEQQAKFKNRFQQAEIEHNKLRENWRQQATAKSSQKPISPEWLCYCVNEVIDDDTIFLEESVTNRASLFRQINRTQPGTFFRSGGSSLGWALGAALGTS